MKKDMITPNRLRALLRYEPETGKLFWRSRPESDFIDTPLRSAAHSAAILNSKLAGKEAFTCVSRGGHRQGIADGHPLLAHRVIWAIQFGSWPLGHIDHINGDPSDNRLTNLRDVSSAENTRNTKRYSNNKSGIPGVYRSRSGKWWTYISGRYLGTYDTFDEAVTARRIAEIECGFHPNHGREESGDAALEALSALKQRAIQIRAARAA